MGEGCYSDDNNSVGINDQTINNDDCDDSRKVGQSGDEYDAWGVAAVCTLKISFFLRSDDSRKVVQLLQMMIQLVMIVVSSC